MMEVSVEPMQQRMTILLQEVQHAVDFTPFILTVDRQGRIFLKPIVKTGFCYEFTKGRGCMGDYRVDAAR